MFKSIDLKCVHYGPKFKAAISHYLCYIIGLNFASSCMWKFSAYFEDGRMLESVGIRPLIVTGVTPWRDPE